LIKEDTTFLRRNFRDVHLEAFAGLSHEEMHDFILDYIHTERHPVFGLLHRDMVYVPMLELVRYLEEHQFEVYVVSASMQEFVRAIGEPMLGIPPQRVIGSAVAFDIERREGAIRSVRRQEWFEPYNLREGKSIRILERIGRRPILAFGNGDGDVDMLRLAALNPMPSLALVLDHNDDERDMFDRKPYLLRVAESGGWPVVRVREDFRVVFPGNPAKQLEEEAVPALDEAAMLNGEGSGRIRCEFTLASGGSRPDHPSAIQLSQ
jgi:phosphoserine phosphatase